MTVTQTDIAIYGGGPAGASAAIAAARMGARVLLIERYGFLGGTATAGLVNCFHSLKSMDRKTPIIGGVVGELLSRLLNMGAARKAPPETVDNTIVETEYVKFVLDRMVEESGAQVLFHALAGRCERGPERIGRVFAETKAGSIPIEARVHIDCTGDADVAARAGLPFEMHKGQLQPPTLCMRMAGIDKTAFDAWGKDVERDLSGITAILVRRAKEMGWEYTNYLWGNFSDRRPGEVFLAAIRIPNVDATDVWELSRAELAARRQLFWMADVLREEVPGFAKATIIDVAAHMGIRETCRIKGAYALTGDELIAGKRFEDAIAQGTYPIDIHASDGRGITFQYLNGWSRRIDGTGAYTEGFATPDGKPLDIQYFQVPYRCLYFKECANLLVAGRPISVDRKAFAAIRVMVNCMQFGQAAGVAAALAAREKDADVRKVDPAELRGALRDQGAIII